MEDILYRYKGYREVVSLSGILNFKTINTVLLWVLCNSFLSSSSYTMLDFRVKTEHIQSDFISSEHLEHVALDLLDDPGKYNKIKSSIENRYT